MVREISTDFLRIDISKKQTRRIISACQEDTIHRTIHFLLSNNGIPMDLSNLFYAEILVNRVDGTVTDNPCIIEGDDIQYTLNNNDIAVIGENVGHLLLTFSDGTVFESPDFYINVFSTFYNPAALQSQNEYLTLTQQVLDASGYASDAQSSADSASEYADNAQGYASDAQTAASETSDLNSETADYMASTSEYAASASQYASTAGSNAAVTGSNVNSTSAYAASAASQASLATVKASETANYMTSTSEYMTSASEYASAAGSSATKASECADSAQTYASNAHVAASETSGYKSEAADYLSSTSELMTSTSEYAASASEYAAGADSNRAITDSNVDSTSAYLSSASAHASEADTAASEAANYMTSTSEYVASASEYASTAGSHIADTSSNASLAASYMTSASSYASEASSEASYANSCAEEAEYWYNQAESIAEGFAGAFIPMGTVTFANLPTLADVQTGWTYNVSDEFETTDDFLEGEGLIVPAGSNVYKTAQDKWDILAGTPVVGVKGDSEQFYRRGNVNITKSNVGLSNVRNEDIGDTDISSIGATVKAAILALFNKFADYQTKLTNPLTRSNIKDVLNSTSTTDVLSANQGKALNDKIEALDASDPTASGTSVTFIATLSQADGLISATKKTVSTVAKSAAGLCPALPNETATTKYLRQDGTWVAPPNDNTDTNVTQTISSTSNADYRVLLSGTADDTTRTEGARKDTDFKYNPSTNILTVPKIVVTSNTDASGTADNKPALIVGGASTAAHLELDSNELMAKGNGTTTGTLFIQNDGGDTYFNGPIRPQKGSIQIITGSGTAAQDKGANVSPRYYPALWKFNLGRTPVDGDTVTIKVPVAGHDYGVFVSLNNGTNYYPVRVDYGTGRLTTQFPINSYITLVYTSVGVVNSVFAAAGANDRSNITGCFQVLNWYNTNTTTGTTYTAGNVPDNTTFATNGSVKNAYDGLNTNKANLSLLKANNQTAQLTYSNGKYGFTINGTFYEIGGGTGEVQPNYYFAVKSGANVDVDISNLSNSDEITISCGYLAGNGYVSERVAVSTAKGYTNHSLTPAANIGTNVTYSNGKLVFSAIHATAVTVIWFTVN